MSPPPVSSQPPVPLIADPYQESRVFLSGILPRLAALACLFLLEMLVLSVWLDNDLLAARGGAAGFVGQWGAWLVRGAVCFAAIYLMLVWPGKRAGLKLLPPLPAVKAAVLLLHLAAMAVFAAFSWALYGDHLGVLSPDLCFWLWFVTGISAMLFAALALVPIKTWRMLLAGTWVQAALGLAFTVAACLAGNSIRLLWAPAGNITFRLARILVGAAVHDVVSNPAAMTLGTPRFTVEIAPACSGFEGIGLMLAFSLCWLWFFRSDYRFPRVLLLVPAGVIAIFLLNSVRIAALILIGNAGAPGIAAGGFHSQAGWIAFNAVALGFCVAAPRLRWIRRDPAATTAQRYETSENPAIPYLLPFLVLMATGMLCAAFSGSFEWLYPLRLVAVAGVLWLLRRRFASCDFKFGWYGPTVGVVVFVLWMAFDAMLRTPGTDSMPLPLATASPGARFAWIAARFAAVAITVPIAEELAFRGFLLRRFMSSRFEDLPSTAFRWSALVLSSVAFGLLHGRLWLPATLAGMLYAAALIRRGRIGEAIAAHATTNALIGCSVLLFHQWHLWM